MMADGASVPEFTLFERGDYVTCKTIKGHGIGTIERFAGAGTYMVYFASGFREIVHENDLQHSERPVRKPPKPPLKLLSYEEMERLPDPEWLIEGVLQQGTSALLFGRSNSFKSFLAIDMACSIAITEGEGGNWHGHEIPDYCITSVMYVASEGQRGVAKQRIPGWYEARGIPRDRRGNLMLYPQEIALDDDKAVQDLITTCAVQRAIWHGDDYDPKAARVFGLIVLDIFGSMMMGPETSDETARAWVRNINRIMRETGCAVLTVAHTGWADETRARMHTHFWGSFDTRLKAEGDKDSRTTVLTVDRHKDADSAGVWGFRLDPVEFKDVDGNAKSTLVPRLCDEVETGQRRRVSGKPAVALQALSEALIEHGRTIAGPNYPSCPVVSVEHWRIMCDRHGLTESDNPETRRKAFNRAKDALIGKELVKQFDGDVWKVSTDG